MKGPYLDIQSPQGNRQVVVGHRPLTIGRHPDNRCVIGDVMASRYHCVIEHKSDGTFELRDLNSSNGTLVHGKPVRTTPLRPGDTVVIGSTRLTLIDPSAPPPEEPEFLGEDDLVLEEPELIETLSEDDVIDPIDRTEPPTRSQDNSPIPLDADFSLDGLSELEALEQVEPVRYRDDDEPIHMEIDDTPTAGPIEAEQRVRNSDQPELFEQTLISLADSIPDRPFGEDEIALISARGQIMHPARSKTTKGKKREPVDLFRLLLVICTRTRATDIHLEPRTDHYQLRLRVDGLMADVTRMPVEMGTRLSALVKVLSDIDISQRTIVQEGHFAAELPGIEGMHAGVRRADYRVSFAPAMFGQKLVIRIFDAANAPLKIDGLQLPTKMLSAIKKELEKETGMLLVCGPTGSGKTTTLYAMVRSSDVTRRNVVTIEDPIEVQLENVTQIQTDDANGKSFGVLLRSVLRQDPDAILVGEIRDAETARIAMQAAITGHLVFSTVHTTSTIGAIFRMLDLGVEPFLVAQGLQLVLAQRLVRKLCPFCRKAVAPTDEQKLRMGPEFANVNRIYEPRGCQRCLNTGYRGRQAFFELLTTTDKLRDIIVTTRTMEDIKKTLEGTGFQRLEQTGFQLVAEGAVPFDEIETAVGR